MTIFRYFLFALLISVAIPTKGRSSNQPGSGVLSPTKQLEILSDFRDFLALPNVATSNEDMLVNAHWITSYIGKRGFTSQIVSAGGAPYVLAEKKTQGATKTIVIYAHFDGQPVAPENWASPPFEPILRTASIEEGGEPLPWPTAETMLDPNWRIFARSAGDDKAPVIALMAAIDSLEAAGKALSVNIKLILDGEEEAGSPSLDGILHAHAAWLKADLMLFCDGPMHQSRKRQLVFGVRGSMTLELTTYGPLRPLHSGHYGNWAPNPTDRLMKLLVSLKDDNGRITVPGYHDQIPPITETELQAVAALPDISTSLAHELALGATEGGGLRLEALMMEPAIVIKGFDGGGVGDKARNIIMPSATASLNLRLASGQTPAHVEKTLTTFFRNSGFHTTKDDPTPDLLRAHAKVLKTHWVTGGYGAFRSSLDSEPARKLTSILNELNGEKTLLMPTLGGSLPIYLFKQALPDMPIIILPIANHDNNQHGRNENLRLKNLWDAVEVYAAILAQYGRN
ncbi:MAG: peptidase M20 [Kordiimonadales bacterium]|nr:MAG: peptidase M20 [Kordiimonadales bacterium]